MMKITMATESIIITETNNSNQQQTTKTTTTQHHYRTIGKQRNRFINFGKSEREESNSKQSTVRLERRDSKRKSTNFERSET